MSEHRLYQSVAKRIREAIEGGEFRVGSRLPGERELAERFNVSRVTIREAEIALEALGWISIKTGSGVYVLPRDDHAAGSLPDVTAFDLTAARAVFEAEAAALAAANIDGEALAELEALVSVMSSPTASDTASSAADQQFHETIARLSGNPVVEYCIRLIWRMRNELPKVKQVYQSVCHHDWASRTDEHLAILNALRARDPQASRAAMRDHFHRLFEAMLAAEEAEALAEIRRRTQQDRDRFMATLSAQG
ncbi:FadR/GntR family transcriptional regulator [Brevundimonas sp.]|uniref:FadR/GntR family transcriptional regulator n=1 Tax=Brevundimonas sp. TaxID=1871086 RepID=UPI00289B0DB4|nr:FadR/GntR family transcriptional regulator [Brevundimonas sp.]